MRLTTYIKWTDHLVLTLIKNKMKKFFYLLTLGILFSNISYSQHFHIDSSEDEDKVKKAVLSWADSVFYMHKEWKFEHFHAFYTEEYEIAYLRLDAYKERLEELEKEKSNGSYRKSDEEYEKEHKHLQDTYTQIQEDFKNITVRATHYKISFWSNIQTNDGITVYYEHIVTLNNDYQVTDAEINSAIGKKSDKTTIIYKKDIKKK